MCSASAEKAWVSRGSMPVSPLVRQENSGEYFARVCRVGRLSCPTWMIRLPSCCRTDVAVVARPVTPRRNGPSESCLATMVSAVADRLRTVVSRSGTAAVYVVATEVSRRMSVVSAGRCGLRP